MPVVCWAATQIHGNGLAQAEPAHGKEGSFCEIEGQVIDVGEPYYHVLCCSSDYHLCPTWRTHKERGWRDRASDVEAMRKEAIERLHGPEDPIVEAVARGEADPEELLAK